MTFQKGNIPWNKYLSKETDKRVEGYSKNLIGKKRTKEFSERYKGEGNPNYQKGNESAKRIVYENHKTCKKCNSTEDLNLHHKDKNRDNNDLSNLILLCRSCHSKEHRGEGTGWNIHNFKQ